MLLFSYNFFIAASVFITSTLAAAAAAAVVVANDITVSANNDLTVSAQVVVTNSALATLSFPMTYIPSTTWLTVPKPTPVTPPTALTSYYAVVNLDGPWNLPPLPKCRKRQFVSRCSRKRIYRIMRVLKETLPKDIPPQRHIPVAGAVDRVAWVHDELCDLLKKWNWEAKYIEFRGLHEEGDEEPDFGEEEDDEEQEEMEADEKYGKGQQDASRFT